MLDLNIPDLIDHWRKTGDWRKWGNFIVAEWAAAWMAGLGAFSICGASAWAAYRSPSTALTLGFLGACGAAATAMWLTGRRHDLWKDLKITLPKELGEAVATTDIVQTDNRLVRDGADPEVRKVLE